MSIHRWFTGFFLLIVMLTVLAASSWIFAARSFQEHFTQVAGNNSVFSADAIVKTRRAVMALEAKDSSVQARVDGLQHQLDVIHEQSDASVAQLNNGAKILSAKIRPLETQAKIEKTATTDESYIGVSARLAQLQQTPSVDQAQVKALAPDFDKLTALNDQIVAKEEEAKPIEADARTLQVQLNNDRQQLVLATGSFANHFDQVESEYLALQKSSPLGFGAYLAEIHPAFLSAILVMVMGALGSLLFLFPAYIANRPGQEVTFDSIVVRTVFGMVVAFAFAIVYHLGLALASATGGTASNIDTVQSPFVIGGLGIVAGVMGDDIAKWIHDRGAYLFKTSDGATFSDVARGAATAAATNISGRVLAPTKSDLPSGGLANPHGGPTDPS